METRQTREPWNKGKLIGQKPPLKPKEIWAIRIHLQNAHSVRDLALFNVATRCSASSRAQSFCDGYNLRIAGKTLSASSSIIPAIFLNGIPPISICATSLSIPVNS